MATLLHLDKITKRFGGLVAVNNVDFRLEQGTIASIIGPNGAGKTTLFNVITGIYTPEEGAVTFADQKVAGRRPDQITALGMCRTFQNISLFQNMSVIENVLVGAHTRLPVTVWGAIWRTKAFRETEQAARAEARRWLRYVELPSGIGDQIAECEARAEP